MHRDHPPRRRAGPRRRLLGTPGLRLAALEWWPGAPRKVLALHGWMDNAASFTPLAPLLAGCNVVAVDLPGHGRSAHRPPGVPYHFIDYVGDALGAADALGWRSFDLLGHSLGAGIGTVAAAVAPERVRSLVLIEGIGPVSAGTTDEGAVAGQLGAAIAQLARGSDRPARRYPALAEVVEARRAAGAMSAGAAALLVRRNLVRGADGYRWRTDRRLLFRSPLYLVEAQVRGFLREIRCPSLLVTGAQSQILPAAVVKRRRGWIKGLQVVRLDGGHHLHMDDPAPVADAVNTFYQDGGRRRVQ